MMNSFNKYEPRPIQFLGIEQTHGWRTKLYGISVGPDGVSKKTVTEAKSSILQLLPQPAVTDERYGLGFLIIHAGVLANWFLLDWWENEDIAHQLVFSSPTADPSAITPVSDKSVMACVHELKIHSFESDAWIKNVLSKPNNPDFDEYLNTVLNSFSETDA